MSREAQTDRWCILTCANCKTLDLVVSLNDAGFEAWSPVETVSIRARKGDKREEVRRPMMASFVFARADRLLDLLALSHSPTLNYQTWDAEKRRMVTRGHPFFRLFPGHSDPKFVPDDQLEPLRRAEIKGRPKGKRLTFPKGALVRLTEGGFAGLNGIVEECRGDIAIVTIDDWAIPVQIPTWLLHPALDEQGSVQVSGSLRERSPFAKAA
jgi:transcription antitermination factor NusG